MRMTLNGVPHRVEFDEVDLRVALLPLATASLVVDGSFKTGDGEVVAEVEQIPGGFKVDAEIEELKRASAELAERLNEAVGHQPDLVQEALVSELFRLKRSLTRQIEEIDEFAGRLSVGQVSS